MKPKTRLLQQLADVGVTADDYRKVQRIQQLLDQLNASLASRGLNVAYAVMMVTTQPPRTEWPSQITE